MIVDLTGLAPDLLKEMYRRMVLVREFELRAIAERRIGLIPGFIHASIGQEASAVGVGMAMRAEDVFTSTHRGHGHLIGKGGDVARMMAELAARSTGYCGGRGGSLHIADFALGSLGANGIVAGGIPIAVGAALAFAMRGEGRVAVSFFGDGAANEGAFHEALNLAGLWRLPVVFICENNLYGEGTPQHKQAPIADLALRAESYAFRGVIVDGNDAPAVYRAASEALSQARQGLGPTLIECKTYRWHGHYEGDPQVYKPAGELQEWQQRCPIVRLGAALIAANILSEADLEAIRQSVRAQLDEAVAYARRSPHPQPEEALAGVYAETHGGKVF